MSKIFGDEGKPIISKRIPRRAAFLPFWRLTSLSGHRIKMILKHNDYCQKAETAFRVNACRWFCLSGLLRCKKKAEEEERKKRTDGTAFWQQSTILLLASSFSSLAARGNKNSCKCPVSSHAQPAVNGNNVFYGHFYSKQITVIGIPGILRSVLQGNNRFSATYERSQRGATAE